MSREEDIIYAKNLRTALNMANNFSAKTMKALDAAIKALEKEPCEDAISRQSMLDYLKYLHGEMPEEEFVKALPSVKPQEPKWIPVSERLPEKEGWYITTVESETTGKRRIENDLFAVDIALAHGHTPNKFCKDGYRQRTVAWMPLPEPYKAESEDKE